MIAVSVFNHPGIHRHLSPGQIFHFHSIYEPNPKFKSPPAAEPLNDINVFSKLPQIQGFLIFVPSFQKCRGEKV